MLRTLHDGPCRDCKKPVRTPTCKFDGACQKFEDWRKRYEEDKAKYEDSIKADKLYNEVRRDRIEAINRRLKKW